MTTPEEDYERRLENMRAALARAWDEGYDSCANARSERNPYRKEGE